MDKIKVGSTVRRKNTYYEGITGEVLSITGDKARVKWNGSTGTRAGNGTRGASPTTTVNLKSIKLLDNANT